MEISKNVTNRAEMAARIIIAIALVVLGLSLTGYLRPVCIAAGVFLLLTSLVGY